MKVAVSLLFVASLVAAITLAAAPPQAKDNNTALVARGKYLVNNAVMCADCHTPRDAKGQFIRNQWLQGAPLGFKPVHPVPGWADVALPIAGLPSMASDEEAIKFLMTGKRADGSMAAPPMPEFRFNRRDAEAIVAYLRSLGGTPTNAAEKSKR